MTFSTRSPVRLRPHRHQSALRDVAGLERIETGSTYRRAAVRQTAWSSSDAERRRPPRSRRGVTGAGQLGALGRRRLVRAGFGTGSPPPAATPTWRSARCWSPSEYVESGCPMPGLTGSPDYLTATGLAGLLRSTCIEAVGMGWLVLHRNDRAVARHAHRGLALSDRAAVVAASDSPVSSRRSCARSSRRDLLAHPLDDGR